MERFSDPRQPPACEAYPGKPCSAGLPPVLDACCGSRMFWFDRADNRAMFVDKRRETHTLPDVSSAGGSRELVISPDLQADFTNLPFPSASFALVVFDPPHFKRNGARSWVGLKYGTLAGDWPEMLRAGFAECFRVLKPEGVLIFKWCADEIPVSRILELTPERPLFGHRSGKQQKTHWIAFIKQNVTGQGTRHLVAGTLDPIVRRFLLSFIAIDSPDPANNCPDNDPLDAWEYNKPCESRIPMRRETKPLNKRKHPF